MGLGTEKFLHSFPAVTYGSKIAKVRRVVNGDLQRMTSSPAGQYNAGPAEVGPDGRVWCMDPTAGSAPAITGPTRGAAKGGVTAEGQKL